MVEDKVIYERDRLFIYQGSTEKMVEDKVICDRVFGYFDVFIEQCLGYVPSQDSCTDSIFNMEDCVCVCARACVHARVCVCVCACVVMMYMDTWYILE
jgi:hypothetical protein